MVAAAGVGAVWALSGAAPALTQETVVVAPGPHYAASGLKAVILGSDYRDAWATPIRVPVLDFDEFAGGITPTERGGGNQTVSLRFQSAAGREYTFRSVDKNPRLSDEPALAGTVIGALVQDQVSSMHPAAALIVPPILDAVGIVHPEPMLAVMPDDPRLGEFREEFAGMLGLIEERPDEREGDLPGFGGFTKIVATETLFERLEEDPANRVAATEFLTARLVDLMIGDWDRHHDQWRWAEMEEPGGVTRYHPIPRDRDYAVVDYDGLLMIAGRAFVPNAVLFDRSFNVDGLTLSARELDHSLLTELERPAFDSVAAFIASRVTDEVIDEAIGRLPPEYLGETAEQIRSVLLWRRDHLPEAAAAFYRLLATEVDVRATDQDDVALVERGGDGTVRVRLYPRSDAAAAPQGVYYDRTFREDETHEIRVYLRGGDDHARVLGGSGRSIMVRVVGGGSDDLLVDSSTVRGLTAFYDDRGDNQFVTGRGTEVDTYTYEDPEPEQALSGESFRDWGSLRIWQPSVDYQSTEGPILGLTRRYTRFGFRQVPYAFTVAAGMEVGLYNGAIAADVTGDFRRAGGGGGFEMEISASQLDPIHFYGFGNDTEAVEDTDFYVVRQNRFLAGASWYREIGRSTRFSIGPVAKFTRTQEPPGTPFAAAHVGGRHFGQLGARSTLVVDTRDAALFPRHGALLEVGGSGYPAVWDADEAFGELHAVASAYVTPSVAFSPTLAVRVGGKQLWGDFPIHEAAFLGGSATIRGHTFQRYAGDAMVFGNAEARVPVAPVKIVVRGDLGILGLVDAGRVYVDGASPEGWHTAYGGGVWFRFQVRSSRVAATAAYAQGEKGTLYLKLGVPF